MYACFVVRLEPQADGGYTASVPCMPGCISEGDTKEEAIANAKEAYFCYVSALKAAGLPIPKLETEKGRVGKFEILVEMNV